MQIISDFFNVFSRYCFGRCCGLPGAASQYPALSTMVTLRCMLYNVSTCLPRTISTRIQRSQQNGNNALNVPSRCVDQAAKELAERKANVARNRKERQAKETAKAKR